MLETPYQSAGPRRALLPLLALAAWAASCGGHTSDPPDGTDGGQVTDAGVFDASTDGAGQPDGATPPGDGGSQDVGGDEADAEVDVSEVDVSEVDVSEDEAPEDEAPEEEAPETAAIEQLEDESDIDIALSVDGGIPTFVSFAVPIPAELPDDPVVHALDFLQRYQALYRLSDPASQLVLNRVRFEEDAGFPSPGRHVFFSQQHHGVPVYLGELAVHSDDVYLTGTNGRYLPEIPALPGPEITTEQAELVALAGVSGFQIETVGVTSLMYFNLGLVRGESPDLHETHLAWRVTLTGYADDEVSTSWLCFIDAHDGELLMALDQLEGHSADKDFDIMTANYSSSSTCWWFTNEDDDWFDEDGEVNYTAAGDPFNDGRDAFNLAHGVYDFYFNRYHRHSWGGDEEEVEMLVYVADSNGSRIWNNASFNPGCGQIRFGQGFVIDDIVAHEWSHAIDAYEADLVYTFQSGAIDESFADISGAMFDSSDWTIGEDLPIGTQRSMAAPGDFGHPAHWRNYVFTSGPPTQANDNGGVHSNSGIPNQAAFLLTEGGLLGGYQFFGLGRDRAGWLYYNVLIHDLTANTTLQQLRDLVVRRVDGYANRGWWSPFQYTPQDLCTVVNAYAVVGLSPQTSDADCDGEPDSVEADDDGDRIIDFWDNCPEIKNGLQIDTDRDGTGDVCDTDRDGDGIANRVDNCPGHANPSQNADFCTDTDRDGFMDNVDNCFNVANWDQSDVDSDGAGDACDTDDDADGLADSNDNCPLRSNPGQEDQDTDRVGDACDNCLTTANADQNDCDRWLGVACDGRRRFCGSCDSFRRDHTFFEPGGTRDCGCEGCPDWLPPISRSASRPTQRPSLIVTMTAAATGQPQETQRSPSVPVPASVRCPTGTDVEPTQLTHYYITSPTRSTPPALRSACWSAQPSNADAGAADQPPPALRPRGS
jgi:hypothetical protein